MVKLILISVYRNPLLFQPAIRSKRSIFKIFDIQIDIYVRDRVLLLTFYYCFSTHIFIAKLVHLKVFHHLPIATETDLAISKKLQLFTKNPLSYYTQYNNYSDYNTFR